MLLSFTETGAMAEDSPVQGLCEETTCSICLEYFKDPVTIDCGHNFCRACLAQCWRETERSPLCPQCRETVQQKNFRLNRQLASIVEIAKELSLHTIKGAETPGPVCERHKEPLKLFCQNDQTPICVVCDKSKEHRGHKVIPVEEAIEEYKIKSHVYLEFLKKERKEMWSSQQSVKAEAWILMEETEGERQKIMAEFKLLHQFLEEQERHLLSKLKDLDDQIEDKQNAHIDRLSEEISAVELLIEEMEEKQEQPPNEFLQDLGNIFQRCNRRKFVSPVAFPLELKEQIQNFSKIHPFLDTTITEFKETMTAGPEAKKANFPDSRSCTVPTLVLSTDCSPDQSSFGARQQYSSMQNLVQNFIPISCWSYVMGAERINSESYSWVMNIKDENSWAVGVALEDFRGRSISSLTVKQRICGGNMLMPEQGIWAVGKLGGMWYAFSSPQKLRLVCRTWPRNFVVQPVSQISLCNATAIRVSLNYEQCSVTFFNADENSAIYTFHKASFSGQPVSSWLFVGR